jgi:hypothetical protein
MRSHFMKENIRVGPITGIRFKVDTVLKIILGYDTVWSGTWVQMLRRNL